MWIPSLLYPEEAAYEHQNQTHIRVQANYLDAEDMTEPIGTAQSIRRQINPKLRIGGVFLAMDNDTKFRKEIVESVKENYGKNLPVMETVIEQSEELFKIDSTYAENKHEEGMVGVGGTETFTLTPLKSGKTEVTLTFARPWEKFDAADQLVYTFEIDRNLQVKMTNGYSTGIC